MERKGFINEGKRLELYEWRSAEPRGILFIVHGMAEQIRWIRELSCRAGHIGFRI